MKRTSSCIALCLLAIGLTGAVAHSGPRCPAPLGSTLAEFEACAPAAVPDARPGPATIIDPIRIVPPVDLTAPVLVSAPDATPLPVTTGVRVATVQQPPRKTRRLTEIPWLIGAFQ